MNNPLLLGSSVNFKNSDVIGNIRQSIIDLNGEEDKELIQPLLTEALKYLDQDPNRELANELFSLIDTCFIRCLTDFLNI